MFPLEYAVSGWFKWTNTTGENNIQHVVFRLSINEDLKNDTTLGDRSLLYAVEPKADGEANLHFGTYTYVDTNGNGQPKIQKST
jgi:hypothetical protein